MEELERAVAPAEVTVVYVHDDPATALRRAVEREDAGWEDWYVRTLPVPATFVTSRPLLPTCASSPT